MATALPYCVSLLQMSEERICSITTDNMAIDYTSHPTELVKGGNIAGGASIRTLRNAIPPHCFKSSYTLSFYYLLRDLTLAIGSVAIAITSLPKIENLVLRCLGWVAYGYWQGLIFTGLWVIGHECGHGAFSPSHRLNSSLGFILHSSLLTPYFSWRSSHRRHHIYANNLSKDHNFVPPQKDQYASSLLVAAQRIEELTEDSPVVIIFRIVLQQLLGFPWYLLTNITASPGSLHRKPTSSILSNSHFLPSSALFRPEEAKLILLSDVGIAIAALCLWRISQTIGWPAVLLLYGQPYLWVNHWIVAITYLHHTHPNLPKFENASWTFLKGATATVDRSYGWIGKHLLHNIIDYHVIHHLFSTIPFYHTEEATKAIIPILGDAYHSEKDRSFLAGLFESFTKCQWVEPDNPDADPKDRTMWYRSGPSPPPETSMGRKGFSR